MNEEPLIHTSLGNVPISELECKVEWQFDQEGIFFIEEYYYGDALVKRSAHRYQYNGTQQVPVQGNING